MQFIDTNFNSQTPWPMLDKFKELLHQHPELLTKNHNTEIKYPKETVIIAISPRVGSTALCSALENAGLAKQISEWLNPRGPFPWEFKEHLAGSINHYISDLFTRYSSREIFVFKCTWMDFSPLVDNNLVDLFFPKRRFIFVERINKAAQAVSLYKALTSNQWHLPSNMEKPKNSLTEFKITSLAKQYQFVLSENDNWKNYLLADSSPVLRITYESFENNIMEGVNQIFDFLGYEQPDHVEATYQKISDAVSVEWSHKLNQYMHGDYQSALDLDDQKT